MNFKDYLTEFNLSSTPELQTSRDRSDARQLLVKVRTYPVGRSITATQNQSKETDPFTTSSDEESSLSSMNDKDPMVIKNNSLEMVIVDKHEDGQVFITLLNKQKQRKRTIAIETRGGQLLKRYI